MLKSMHDVTKRYNTTAIIKFSGLWVVKGVDDLYHFLQNTVERGWVEIMTAQNVDFLEEGE